MPLPNEHSCRLRNPGDFKPDSFRRVTRDHEGKKYDVIMGRLRDGDTMTEQAYRYPKDTWTADEARVHCKEHDGKTFEPAKEEKSGGNGIERRAFDLLEIRVRRDDGAPPMISGHAAVFNQLSEPLGYGGMRERILPGAFTKTLQEADVRSLFNHDPNYVLGRTKSGTLQVSEDEPGLAFEVQPPDTTWARDLMVSIDRGDIDQASFQFRTVKDRQVQEGGQTIRELLEVELFDVSPVTFPAYPQTDVQVRSTLVEVGIDWDILADCLGRAYRGCPLVDCEEEVIKRSIEVLAGYLHDEPGQEPHSAGDGDGAGAGAPLSVRRRRLELAETEV